MLDVQAQGYHPQTWSSPPQANQPHLRDWKTEAQQDSLIHSRLKLPNKAGFCPGPTSNSLGWPNSGWAESGTEVTAHWQLEGEMPPTRHHHTARNYYPRSRRRGKTPNVLSTSHSTQKSRAGTFRSANQMACYPFCEET